MCDIKKKINLLCFGILKCILPSTITVNIKISVTFILKVP